MESKRDNAEQLGFRRCNCFVGKNAMGAGINYELFNFKGRTIQFFQCCVDFGKINIFGVIVIGAFTGQLRNARHTGIKSELRRVTVSPVSGVG
ncbi:MAG: hypothetical protein HGA29_00985 [Syntrophaceae bacterium]|nr:hypothetical protein [Syntrophaceae bacterium]